MKTVLLPKMERIFIDREWCIAYVVLALDSIYHSGNKERSINDLIKEIREMFDLHTNEEQLTNLMNYIIKKEGNYKIIVQDK